MARSLYVLALVVGCSSPATLPVDATPAADAPEVPTAFDDLPGVILGPGLPGDLPTQFEAADGAGTGPCIVEPTSGALVPRNFTPPAFEWLGGAGLVFELRLHVDNQRSDLVVYTQDTSFALPADVWRALAEHSADHAIEYAIRSATFANGQLTSAPLRGTSGTLGIAPVTADGTIVYWTTTNGSALKGFRVGDTAVSTVLAPSNVDSTVRCIGCHTSSPDGTFALFSRRDSGIGSGDPFGVDARLVDGSAGAVASITANARAQLARTDQNFAAMSPAHFTDSERIVISTLKAQSATRTELVYTNLSATTGGTGVLARTGDPGSAAEPAWSHDGATIAYVSSATVLNGRTTDAASDVRVIPYNAGAGGASVPLQGASQPGVQEVFPAFSPDDHWLSFNRIAGTINTYDEPTSEVYAVAAGGGAPIRLAANDPPACAPYHSPGITNSWARWSPVASDASGGRRFYWLVFSSRRRGGPSGHPQLFLAAAVERGGALVTFPAIYFRNQPAGESNHTPAWDNFATPLQ